MEQYKPLYMGKVVPADNPSKLTDFVANKYDAFSKIYDACKNKSEDILDIKIVDIAGTGNTADTLSIQVSASKDTFDYIKEAVKDNGSVSIKNDVITAKGSN